MAEYMQNPRMTQKDIAEKHGLSYDTVRKQAATHDWNSARSASAQRYAQQVTAMAVGRDAATRVYQADEKQLKLNEEMRYIIMSKLKMRDAQNNVIVRPTLTVADTARAVTALVELYRCDRLALGASTENLQPAPMRDRFAEMSEEELFAELARVREQPMIQ